MPPKTSSRFASLGFFAWVFIISIPFWIIGALIQVNLPIKLPISSLMAFNPMLIALVFIYREKGMDGVKGLLKRIFEFRNITNKRWLWAIFLLMPLIAVLQFGLMLLLGYTIIDPQVPILLIIPLFLLFFIAACGEELGWMGYGYTLLANKRSALEVSILLGIIWAVWHIIPYFQTGSPIEWIFWQCVLTIGLRVFIVWIYVNTDENLFSAIAFHATINVSAFLFPNYGSYYDPFIATIVVMGVVLVIVRLWGKSLKLDRIHSN